MAFLGNDGDIILDSVITDAGKKKLAEGNFKITKYSLGDSEIVYSQYDLNHASGSAYFDLEILQTPIFEAFTNDTAVMNSKLITIPRTNLLYLPIIKLNESIRGGSTSMHASGSFMVAVDQDTEDLFGSVTGVLLGETLGGTVVRVDQGLDTSEIPPSFTIDADLVETQYMIEIDNRFGKLAGINGTVAKISYINDDDVGSYFMSLGTDIEFVSENEEKRTVQTQTIAGPRGTILQFQIQSSLELNTSTYLFNQIGSTTNMVDKNSTTQTVNYIDSYITITGATTGATLDIPVRFIKV